MCLGREFEVGLCGVKWLAGISLPWWKCDENRYCREIFVMFEIGCKGTKNKIESLRDRASFQVNTKDSSY